MNDIELSQRLYVPNPEHWQRQCSKNYLSTKLPTARTIRDGIVLPAKMKEYKEKHRYKGGVCDQNFKFVAGYTNMAPGKLNGWCCLDEAYEVERSEIVTSDEEIIWGGAMIWHFGHFITECMARMWYVVEHPEDQRKVVFVKVNTWKVAPWMFQFFELLGLPKERVLIVEEKDKPIQFKAITIPEQSSRIKHSYNEKFLVPFKKMASAVTPRGDVKQLFLTRSKELKTQMYLANADYFEEFYRRLGYKIVAPETLSAAEQVALITGADEIVTHMGTLAHWSLFCRAGVKWTFINRVDEFSSRQCLINQATGIDWYIVSASKNFMHSEQGGGVCLLGPTDYWTRFALEHYGVKISEDDQRISSAVFDDYVRHWCQYFSKPEHLDNRIKSLKKIYARLAMLETRVKLKRPILCFDVHQAKKGWLPTNIEGDIGGVLNEKLCVQALKIYFSEPFCDVFYSVYYKDGGWSDLVGNKTLAGSTGKNKGIYGLSVVLDPKGAAMFDVIYRIHNFNGEWSPWQANGAKLLSIEHMLDGVQIKLQPKRRTMR